MSRKSISLLFSALISLLPLPARAEITLPHLFSDNMVLQRESPLPIWGVATAGEDITVTLATESRTTKADETGHWKVLLPALNSTDTLQLTIKGSTSPERTFKNVLLGEVWLCSGQSNVDMPIGNLNVRDKEKKDADYPKIRQFLVQRVGNKTPQTDCKGEWVECSDKTIWNFSAVSYYFGRNLHQQLNVPVGLIVSSVGGTAIEPWTSKKSLDTDPDIKDFHAGGSDLYNSMIAPLVPYALRGMIWYQGESNVGNAAQYQAFLSAMIRDRRKDWDKELPVGVVQIAPFRYKDHDPAAAPELWEAELLTQKSLPNVGLAITTDLSDTNDIHPQRKQEVGDRLALWAKAKVYNQKDSAQKDLAYSGPIYKSHKIDGAKIIIEFDQVGAALESHDNKPLSHFTLAGEDHLFHPAKAEIVGKTIVVTSVEVPAPLAARFGWRDDAQPNLYNEDGLPAMPFRTDRWPRVTDPITVPHFFSDHVVLQQQMPIPIWGTAGPGRKVRVTFDKTEYFATADPKGQWKVTLPAMEAGQSNLVFSGPIYKSMKIEENKIRLTFDYTGAGLTTTDNAKELTHFEIAGEDNKFVKATAQIENNTVIVSSPEIPKPTKVRFAWDEQAIPNLINKEGLPATTFRTQP